MTTLIASLEGLASSLQKAVDDKSSEVGGEMERATEATAKIIQTALSPEQRDPWLEALHSATTGATTASPDANLTMYSPITASSENLESEGKATCTCSALRAETTSGDGNLNDAKVVGCMHGCAMRFCSAKCRRRQGRQHAAECPAIARKRVLRAIGFPSDTELF